MRRPFPSEFPSDGAMRHLRLVEGRREFASRPVETAARVLLTIVGVGLLLTLLEMVVIAWSEQ